MKSDFASDSATGTTTDSATKRATSSRTGTPNTNTTDNANGNATGSAPLFATSYFPPISYMAALLQNTQFVIEQHETFPKQTHRNRTVIITASGLMTLSVPVTRPQGTHTQTADIGVSYAERWNVNHWRALETAYNASPYFLYYRDEIEKLLMRRYDRLLDLNEAILQYLLKKIKHSAQYKRSDDYLPHPDNDLRNHFDYKHTDPKINIPTYSQVFADRMPFQPHVSILDLLFNVGPDTKEYLRKVKP